MIEFADQAALDAYVKRVLLAHIDSSAKSAMQAVDRTVAETGVPEVAAGLLRSAVGITIAVQHASVLHLPLPEVAR